MDFKLAGSPGQELVFLNPEHADRLTHVVYRRVRDGAMVARVEVPMEERRLRSIIRTGARAAGRHPAHPSRRCDQ